VTKLGRRCQLLVVLVRDARLLQRRLQTLGIGPGVLRTTDAPALADVEDLDDLGLVQAREERVEAESLDTDRRRPRHGTRLPGPV
jgi:hypothetical protein